MSTIKPRLEIQGLEEAIAFRQDTLYALKEIERDGEYISLDTNRAKQAEVSDEIDILEQALTILIREKLPDE